MLLQRNAPNPESLQDPRCRISTFKINTHLAKLVNKAPLQKAGTYFPLLDSGCTVILEGWWGKVVSAVAQGGGALRGRKGCKWGRWCSLSKNVFRADVQRAAWCWETVSTKSCGP